MYRTITPSVRSYFPLPLLQSALLRAPCHTLPRPRHSRTNQAIHTIPRHSCHLLGGFRAQVRRVSPGCCSHPPIALSAQCIAFCCIHCHRTQTTRLPSTRCSLSPISTTLRCRAPRSSGFVAIATLCTHDRLLVRTTNTTLGDRPCAHLRHCTRPG